MSAVWMRFGILVGRLVWTAFARQLGIAAVLPISAVQIAATIAGALFAGMIIAWPLARHAARLAPATSLRGQ